MLSFVQSWFVPGANPVGIDIGAECLRLAQVEKINGDHRLIAAASAEIPLKVRGNPAERMAYFARTLKELWARGNFRGRRAVLAIPAGETALQHLRLPRMSDETLQKALPWESRGKLPFDPAEASLRHIIAGEVYQDHEPRNEVILMAAKNAVIEQLLSAAASARLEVVGMNVQPKALVDCFLNIYRRKADADITNCIVDIGSSATRAIVARGGKILFARSIPIGGEDFSRAVAAELQIRLDEARQLRIVLSNAPDEEGDRDGIPVMSSAPIGPTLQSRAIETDGGGGVATIAAPHVAPAQRRHRRSMVEQVVREPLERLAEELTLCRRYHEAAFPERPIQRLIFVGGEARNRRLCQSLAKELDLAAQIGDPMARMSRTTEIGIESGIDRRCPQPAWAVAIGSSMGSLVPGSEP
ncbi:MAG TPA: pilus assembly protein PilM [Tepidisphaeraceae bacterium]|jgi:type IV pilus assembly protein PilM|nr:pilus assembly protein PilM [Tepidisphaeraceae bacterium]